MTQTEKGVLFLPKWQMFKQKESLFFFYQICITNVFFLWKKSIALLMALNFWKGGGGLTAVSLGQNGTFGLFFVFIDFCNVWCKVCKNIIAKPLRIANIEWKTQNNLEKFVRTIIHQTLVPKINNLFYELWKNIMIGKKKV